MLIAVLCVFQLAIVGEAVVAIRGDGSASASSLPNLVEGGPHKVFAAGSEPSLTVDIGYADLTVLADDDSHIDVSVRPTTSADMFQTKSAISAVRDGDAIKIAVDDPRWSTGDDRMVTVLVPAHTRVTVLHAGNIVSRGLRAEASLTSTGEGTITVDDFDGPALRLDSGHSITMHRVVAERLDADSSDGNVEGTSLAIRDGSIQSDGRVMLGLTPGTDTLITAEAKSGKIVTTGFVPLPASVSESKSAADDDDSSSQTVRAGAGNGHLDVQSDDGNITLAREE